MIDSISNYSGDKRAQSRQTVPENFERFKLMSSVSDNEKSDFSPQMAQKKYLEEKKTNELGKRVLKVAALTTLCVVIVLKGAPRKLRSKFNQLHKNLIDKDKHHSRKEVELGECLNKGFSFTIREGLRRITEASKAIFNLAPLKDVLISKVMGKTKFTTKLSQGITNLFERISSNTLRHSYSKTNEKLEILFAHCDELNAKIPTDKAKIINEKIAQIRKLFAEGFGETARRKRLTQVKNEFDGFDPTGTKRLGDSLMDKVWEETYKDLKGFFSKKTFTKFISEELATGTKMRNASEVSKHKYKISNSLEILYRDCFELLVHIDTFINPTDETRPIIKKIATSLKGHKEAIKTNKVDGRASFLDSHATISDNLTELDNAFKNSKKYNSSVLEEVSKEIGELKRRLENPERGVINEISHIYKQVLQPHELNTFFKLSDDAAGSLEKSTDLETDKMFDKVRDLKIGSAPKDVLLLMMPLGAVGYGLSKADSTEEKVSVGIKYGVPIMGALAITMYCTVGLISAGPSLLIGFLSGMALNQIGTGLDEEIKKHKAKDASNTKTLSNKQTQKV